MDNIKAFQVRLPKELWVFVKKQAMKKEKSMNEIIIEALIILKKSKEKLDIK